MFPKERCPTKQYEIGFSIMNQVSCRREHYPPLIVTGIHSMQNVAGAMSLRDRWIQIAVTGPTCKFGEVLILERVRDPRDQDVGELF